MQSKFLCAKEIKLIKKLQYWIQEIQLFILFEYDIL